MVGQWCITRVRMKTALEGETEKREWKLHFDLKSSETGVAGLKTHINFATSYPLPLGNCTAALLHPLFLSLSRSEKLKLEILTLVQWPFWGSSASPFWPPSTWWSTWSHSTPSAGWGLSWWREKKSAEPSMAPVWLVHLQDTEITQRATEEIKIVCCNKCVTRDNSIHVFDSDVVYVKALEQDKPLKHRQYLSPHTSSVGKTYFYKVAIGLMLKYLSSLYFLGIWSSKNLPFLYLLLSPCRKWEKDI